MFLSEKPTWFISLAKLLSGREPSACLGAMASVALIV